MLVMQHAALRAQQQHIFWQDNFILDQATMLGTRVSISASMKDSNTYNPFDASDRLWLQVYFA
jgi:hypothetical protein